MIKYKRGIITLSSKDLELFLIAKKLSGIKSNEKFLEHCVRKWMINSLLDKREFNFRSDGRIEWVCKHGIGHTVWVPKLKNKKEEKVWWVHTCDGCCKSKEIKDLIKFIKEAF